jgi:alkanesulfonate monooxygenase SsuD/methylene tetrahydromethanopterin reductase-like flavin-dependent oxidoreductase (luciferase family)
VPEIWILGSGSGSAALAGQIGAGFGLALFIGDGEKPSTIVEEYLASFRPGIFDQPRTLIAAGVICADSDPEAERLARSEAKVISALFGAQRMEALSPPEAIMLDELPPAEARVFRSKLQRTILGRPEVCAEALYGEAKKHRAQEIMMISNCYRFEDTLRSYQRLAQILSPEAASGDLQDIARLQVDES